MRYLYLSETDGREALAAGLRALGHVVTEAAPRDGVVEVVRELPREYDAIIVDTSRAPWDAEAVDFLEVARHCDLAGGLISDQSTAVVVLAPPGMVAAALHCGADAAIAKPATVEQVAAAVEDAIRHRRRAPPRLLLVDDSEQARLLLSNVLNHGTFEVDSAATFERAIEMARSALAEGRPYVVAALDHYLDDGRTGVELAEALRELDHAIGVVMFSGSPEAVESADVEIVPKSDTDRLVSLALHAAALREAVASALRLTEGLDELVGRLRG